MILQGERDYLMEGEGQATPMEYHTPGHVAAAVIEDIAAWSGTVAGRS